jgi:hypothetical protein
MRLETNRDDSFTIVLSFIAINNQKIINPNHASPLDASYSPMLGMRKALGHPGSG